MNRKVDKKWLNLRKSDCFCKNYGSRLNVCEKMLIFVPITIIDRDMSYNQIAQMELMNAINSINSEIELNEFKDMLARYFAKKAQKAIDALWDDGVINSSTIEKWGEEHMRTPYRYEKNRP